MRNFFSGLAQCGAWACLDEFNRIDVEVLSVVAQYIIVLQLAQKAAAEVIEFEGRTIKIVGSFGIFITVRSL
jgi:dynein heavy chain